MKTNFVVHAALLLGNIGLFLGLVNGQVANLANEGGVAGLNARHAFFGASRTAADGSGLAAMLDTLLKEQALLREELGRMKSQANRPPVSSPQPTEAGRLCQDGGDNAPGVTVYLETSPAQEKPGNAVPSAQQWTAVSFKEVGQAPDGSKQAVMSIHKTTRQQESAGFIPAKKTPHWQ